MAIKNAVIEYTHLGVQHTDHGILSFSIGLNYGGAGQAFGQVCLDDVGLAGDRVATTLGSSLLLGIDRVFELDWEQLKGTSCRAFINDGLVVALGHYLEDRWLWFSKSEMAFVVTPGFVILRILSPKDLTR